MQINKSPILFGTKDGVTITSVYGSFGENTVTLENTDLKNVSTVSIENTASRSYSRNSFSKKPSVVINYSKEKCTIKF